MRRLVVVVSVAVLWCGILAEVANAAEGSGLPAMDLAQAMAPDNSLLTSASYLVTPVPDANAVFERSVNSFPTSGTGFAVLSNGAAGWALNPNVDGNTGFEWNVPAANIRGAWDVTILQVGIQVPQGMNCLTTDFQFLTEEYPESVGTQYHDGFVAELDSSTWSASLGAVNAPNNFAFNGFGQAISADDVTQSGGSTTYDGATGVLTATTPVTAGAHTVYFSIFDTGEPLEGAFLDSTVFLDNLRASTVANPSTQCVRGTGGSLPNQDNTLNVAVVGQGTIASSPTGISCPTDCVEDYADGTIVGLGEAAASGWSFSGWSGGCVGSGLCAVTMDQDRAVTATFVPAGPCNGITVDDVRGPDPALSSGRALASFPNDDAVCDAVWAPNLDSGFVPQGLALLGDGSALVSGYLASVKSTLHIVQLDLNDGHVIASINWLNGGHGGGIEIDQDGRVWVVSTGKLFMWPDVSSVFTAAPAKLSRSTAFGQFDMSYIADAVGPNLWIGSFQTNEILQFPLLALRTKVEPPQIKPPPKLYKDEATTVISAATKTQGAAFHDPGSLFQSSSTSKCGVLSVGLLSRTRYGFAPGAEEIEFDDAGYLWVVAEAGSALYPTQFFPVIAKLDPSKIDAGASSKCKVGM